jgi:actin related protein 2/3 complex subunit 4
MKPFVVARSEEEKCLIEASINSVRISIRIKKAGELEELLSHLFERFISLRADKFGIMRKKPAYPEYDFSFLIIEEHLEKMKKEQIINFILEFMQGIEKEINEMKIAINTQSRLAAGYFMKSISRKK